MKIEYIIILLLFLFFIGIGIIIWLLWRERHKKLDLKAQAVKEAYNDFSIKYNKELQNYQNLQLQKNNTIFELEQIKKELVEKETFNTTLLQIREEELNNLINEKKKFKESQLQLEIDDWAQSAQEAAEFQRNLILDEYQKEIDEAYDSLRNLWTEVNEFKEKRDAINEEILRSRALEEQQEFYRIQLSESSINDIQILNEIRPRLSKIDLLNKLIYDNYISKPTREMAKRVLNGKDPSGIYKVTNIKTKEVYIGKSVTVSTRWINHIKSSAGLDGVADSQFQRALKHYGIENFTWELLEEVPKDKLSEREKYYIEFYNTTKYGYNMRKG